MNELAHTVLKPVIVREQDDRRFIDDLFVLPEARGLDAAAALIDGVKNMALERGWSVVRWIAAEDNYRGRNIYDRVAAKTNWVT